MNVNLQPWKIFCDFYYLHYDFSIQYRYHYFYATTDI